MGSVKVKGGINVQVQLVIETDNRVVGSCRWDLTRGRTAFVAIFNEKLPLITGILQLIQVKSDQIIEEIPFNLPSENIKPGAKNI